MSQLPGTQLMALELQTCQLVHPDWLPMTSAEFIHLTGNSSQSDAFEIVMSRHLIDTHRLVPLTPDLFSHDWTYCVAGGHTAMQALTEQVTGYLIATWVKSTISGEHARGLNSQLGKNVYEQSLQGDQSLRMWTAPRCVPTNTVQFLAEKSRVLVDGLWLHHSPGLLDWARLMSKSLPKNSDTSAEFVTSGHQGITPILPYSLALLNEIDQRLQVEFSIDVAGIFQSFALASVPARTN